MVLRLTSGSVTPEQRAEESVCGVNVDERDVVAVAEQRDDLLGLAEPQQAVVDEDAGELVADGLVDQHRGDGGIDAAGEAADHPALADLRADARDRLVAEGLHRPVAACSRRCAARSCAGAPRHAACGPPRGGTSGRNSGASRRAITANGRVLGRAVAGEAGRQPGDPVAMAHPDRIAPRPCARRPRTARTSSSTSTSARPNSRWCPPSTVAAELRGHGHLPVADAEHRHAAVEDRLRRARAALLVHGFRARRTGSRPSASWPRRPASADWNGTISE